MKVNLKVWRQAGPKEKGAFVTYSDVETTPDTSFLETLDILNESLIEMLPHRHRNRYSLPNP